MWKIKSKGKETIILFKIKYLFKATSLGKQEIKYEKIF